MSWLSKATGVHVKVGGTVGKIANNIGNATFKAATQVTPPLAIVNAKVEGKSWNDALKAGGRAVLVDAAVIGAVVAAPAIAGAAGSVGSSIGSAAGTVGGAAKAAGSKGMSWVSEAVKKIGHAAGLSGGDVKQGVQDVVKGAVTKAETWAKGQFDHAVDSAATTATNARQGYQVYSAAKSTWDTYKVPLLVGAAGLGAFLIARSSARR